MVDDWITSGGRSAAGLSSHRAAEQWLYFFRRAGACTPEELASRLPDPVFNEAAGVLQIIARNPEERQLYDDRLKAEPDEWARTEQAKREGELVGKIELLSQLLDQPYTGDRPLRDLTIGELSEIEAGLQQQLRDRT